MILSELPPGSKIFIDANILVYAFAPDPKYGVGCQEFVDRIKDGEIEAAISGHVFTNVSHRLMIVEACATVAWSDSSIPAAIDAAASC